MSITSLLTQDIVIVHPGSTTDRYNNTVKDWASASRFSVRGWLDYSDSSEVHDRREATVSGWQLYLLTGTAISNGDRVEHDGVTFEVDGPPIHRIPPRLGSQVEHLHVRLNVVEG